MSREEDMNQDVEVNPVIDLNQSISTGLNRFKIFEILMRNAIEGVATSVRDEDYIKLFGTLSALKKSKSAPVKMHKTMKTNLVESLHSEIELMVKEEYMEEKFNKMDSLVDECALFQGRETWRPNGDVNDHVRSHVMEKKLKHKCALEEFVRDREHSTEMLKQQVSELRAQVSDTEAAFERLLELSLDTSVVDNIDKIITEQFYS